MNVLKRIVAAAAIALPVSSFATTIDLLDGHGYEMSRDYSVDGINLTVTGYTGTYYSDIYSSPVGAFGGNGLGVEYAWSPNHAVDNENGWFDMLMFTFDQEVTLDWANLGWWTHDSDMTILAYTGTGSASDSLTGKKWSEAVTTDNWSGNHYIDVAQHGSTANVASGVSSSTWLVGTFLEPVDTNYSRVGNPIGGHYGADYIKLRSVGVTKVTKVPEIDGAQSGLALALLFGLAAMVRERRRFV